MNRTTKFAVGTAATLFLLGVVPTTILANAATPQTKMPMMSNKVQVTQAYPSSTTQVDLVAKNSMAFHGKSIVLRATHTMGMEPMGMTLNARYDDMKKGFVLTDGKMLMPGVTYDVSANWAQISMSEGTFTIPDLLRVQQIAKNQVEVVYDKKVDSMSATDPKNYWIKSNQAMASGIAELGENDKVTPTNGLTNTNVSIQEKGTSGRVFIFTFTSDIAAGVKYTLIPCNVDAANDMGYMGPNFTSSSANTFVGQKNMM